MTARAFARANAHLWLTTLTTAAVVAATPGAAPAVRNAFGFELQPHRGTPAEALDIASTNARVVAALFCVAIAAHHAPRLRHLSHAIALPNVLLVGAAAGAYARPAWLIHLPLEWAALACPLACGRRYSRAAATAATFIVLAALTETYLTPET